MPRTRGNRGKGGAARRVDGNPGDGPSLLVVAKLVWAAAGQRPLGAEAPLRPHDATRPLPGAHHTAAPARSRTRVPSGTLPSPTSSEPTGVPHDRPKPRLTQLCPQVLVDPCLFIHNKHVKQRGRLVAVGASGKRSVCCEKQKRIVGQRDRNCCHARASRGDGRPKCQGADDLYKTVQYSKAGTC